MEDQKEKYVPRFVQQNSEVKRSWYVQFKDWASQKMKYKLFRMNVINELRKANRKDEKMSMLTLESMAPFMMLNAFLFTLFVTRKEGKFMMAAKSIGVCSFTYLAVVFYGEERVFYQNCLRDDVVGYYLREKYLNEMEGHKYFEKFFTMEEEFRKKYGSRNNQEMDLLFKNAELNTLKK